jgi:hypothetical protein
MHVRRSFTVALVVFALSAVPLFANHSWANYHWARTQNPFTLKLGNNFTGVWPSILDTTSSDWSQSTVLDTTIVAGGTGGARRCPATLGRVEECNAKYGRNGWLGVASIWVNGDHIAQGTVKLNDTYFAMAQYDTPAWRNLVSCQETGHTLGLDHQDENFNNANLDTCMDYTSDPSTNQHPNQHDYDQLVTIYTHLDNTTTVLGFPDGVSAAAASLLVPVNIGDDFSEPWQWGTPVAFDPAGRANVFVFERGDGQRVITHVLWANDVLGGHVDHDRNR